MVIEEPLIARVIRVTRPETLLIRTVIPHIQAQVSLYGVLMGTRHHTPECQQAIVDWVEVHADAQRLQLVHCDWIRDSHGRLLIDLLDLQSRESLVGYLIDNHFCEEDGGHIINCIQEMISSKEPEDE